MPSKKPSMIDSLRAKHDPHYKLASKVAGLQDAGGKVDKVEKDIAVKLESLHKTLSKSFGMQRKALMRVAGVEGRIKNLETGVEIWTNREAERSKNQQTAISNLTDVVIQAIQDIRDGKAGVAGASGVDGVSGTDGFDGIDGGAGASGSGGASGSDGASGLDGLDGGAGSSGSGGADGDDGAGGISGESFLDPENYEKFATELQQSGTIAGQQVSPQERKEGFKISKSGLKDKKSKINFRKFLGKVTSKKGKSGKSGSSGSAGGFGAAGSTGKSGKSGSSSAAADVAGVSKDPEAEIDEEGNKSSVGEAIDFLKNVLDPSIIKIEENLGKILGNLEGKVESDKDKAEDLRQSQDAAADDAREAKLEGKGGNMATKSFDKAIKPVTGFFDKLLKFFTNVILGGVVMRIIGIIENPMTLLNPLFQLINGITSVINAIHRTLWNFWKTPINAISEGLSTGVNFLIDGINGALGALKHLGVDLQIPNIKLPTLGDAMQIPMIPLAGAEEGLAMAGGGLVQGFEGGGKAGIVTDPKEKARIEAETLHWVNKERTEFLGLPPLDKISYADGVELTKPMGKEFYGAGITEESSDDMNFDTMTRTTTKWKQRGSELIFEGASERITPEQKQAYFDSNPVARMARDLKDQAEMDDLGASISASAKMNKGGQVPGKGNGDTVPAMLTPGEFVMSKGAVDQIGVDKLMAMNAAGGGTNKPQLMKFAGGGSVPGAPGPRRKGGVTVVGGGGKSGGGGATSGSTPGGLVTPFSSSDLRNTGIMVIKSIYNIGG